MEKYRTQIIIGAVALLAGALLMYVASRVDGWYEGKMQEQRNRGAQTLLLNLSWEYEQTGQIRFSPVLFKEDGSVQEDENRNAQRGEQFLLIKKPDEEIINQEEATDPRLRIPR